MKRSESIGNKLVPLGFAVLLAGIWQAVVDLGWIQRFLLPSPADVAVTLWKVLPSMAEFALTTLQEALIGFAIAIVLAGVLAVLMDQIPVLRKAIYPHLVVSQTIPIIVLAPLFMIWFGLGMLPKVLVVALVCFFPIVISLLEGLGAADPDMLSLMRSMGAGRLQILRVVKFPASLVNFFSGLRIAATYSIMGAVIGEWLGGEGGLGLYLVTAKRSFATNRVLAATVVIVVLSLALFKLVGVVQDLTMPWYRMMRKNSGGNRRV